MEQLAHITDRPFLTVHTWRLNCLGVVVKICGVGCVEREKNGRQKSKSKNLTWSEILLDISCLKIFYEWENANNRFFFRCEALPALSRSFLPSFHNQEIQRIKERRKEGAWKWAGHLFSMRASALRLCALKRENTRTYCQIGSDFLFSFLVIEMQDVTNW